MELYCTPKVNTLQLNTVSNSLNTRTVASFPFAFQNSTHRSLAILPWKRLRYIVVWKLLFHCYVEAFVFIVALPGNPNM
jgi:hypothetical protein